jgi:hypothetical protein
VVRTLDAALTASLNTHSRTPARSLTIEDHVLHYTPFQTPGTADALNDACVASDNSIIRVQVTRNGFASTCLVQRITDPTQGSQWANWSPLPGGSSNMFQDGSCAVSNSQGTLRAFAQCGTGSNALFVWTSTNNGQSWSGPVNVLLPPGGALIKGIASAGNNEVFFLYDVVGGEAVGCSFYSGGSWSALKSWTLAPLVASGGLAVAWNGSSYTLLYSDGATIATCVYAPTTNIWMSGAIVAPATSTAIARTALRLSLLNGVYTLVCVESDSGLLTGTTYSYPRLRQSVDLVHWSSGIIVHALTTLHGAVVVPLPTPVTGTAGASSYLASLTTVYKANLFQKTNSTQFLNVSPSVLSYQREERVGRPARLDVVIDNAGGVYNALIGSVTTNQPIELNASVVLSEGYTVGSPMPTTVDAVQVGIYHLSNITLVRSPQENQLHLVAFDASYLLDIVVRYQNTYSNQTLGFLIQEVCSRAGLLSVTLPTTTQVSQVVPAFVLQAGQTYRHALDELCTTYGLVYFLDQQETMQFRELSASDVAVWSYKPEIEMVSFGSSEQRANHIIVSGKQPHGGQIGALTTAEAYDDVHMQLVGLEKPLHHVDPKLTTTTQCAQKATLLLAQETRSRVVHTVTVPLNPALQLLDCITLTDSAAPIGTGQSATCRIMHSVVHYDAHKGTNEMQLTLEGV